MATSYFLFYMLAAPGKDALNRRGQSCKIVGRVVANSTNEKCRSPDDTAAHPSAKISLGIPVGADDHVQGDSAAVCVMAPSPESHCQNAAVCQPEMKEGRQLWPGGRHAWRALRMKTGLRELRHVDAELVVLSVLH